MTQNENKEENGKKNEDVKLVWQSVYQLQSHAALQMHAFWILEWVVELSRKSWLSNNCTLMIKKSNLEIINSS